MANNDSDFDNSDDDLADLLADNDDDTFSHTKTKRNLPPSNVLQKERNIEDNSKISIQSSKDNRMDKIDNEMGDTLPAFLKDFSSPNSDSDKRAEHKLQDQKFLDDINLTSPNHKKSKTKNTLKSSLEDNDFNNSEDEDLLKSLDSDLEENIVDSTAKNKDSLYDGFLSNLSPKRPQNNSKSLIANKVEQNKNNHLKKDISKNESEKYFSSEQKSRISQDHQSTSPKHEGSFSKQVSFKDLAHSTTNSPLKTRESSGSHLKDLESEDEKKNKPNILRRSQKMGASKDEDMDWLNFFNGSSKKSSNAQSKSKDNVSKDGKTSIETKSASRRRSSNAEWLGLSDSLSPSKSDSNKLRISAMENDSRDWLDSEELIKKPRPQTAHEARSVTKNKESNAKDNQSDANWLSTIGKRRDSEKKLKFNHKSQEPFDSSETNVDLKKDKQDKIKSSSGSQLNVTYSNLSEHTPLKDGFVEQDIQYNENVHCNVIKEPPNILPPNAFVAVQHSTENLRNIHALQLQIDNFAVEKEHLLASIEANKVIYEERISAMKKIQDDQFISSEELKKISEERIRMQLTNEKNILEDQINSLQSIKKELELDFNSKIELKEKEHLKEISKIKELHSQSVDIMRLDHEEALNRLKKLKEQEIDAILSTQAQSRSLQHLAEQLESRASELSSLQAKVDEKNNRVLHEKQAMLEAKENDLKALQNRLHRQLDEGEEERTRLQQLVLRLESRLQKHTTDGEEERWEVQQMKAKLAVQQKHVEEEYKLHQIQIEKEKEKLRICQDSILNEQKAVLLQLAQERQQIMQEKLEIESLAKKIKEEETKLHFKKLKEESYIEKQKQYIQLEQEKFQLEKINLKQELEMLEQGKDSLHGERLSLKSERERYSDLNAQLRRKSNEVEVASMIATEEREKARAELSFSQKIKDEHQSRLQQINRQMQVLMDKEQQLLHEKEKLSEEKLELEDKRKSILCNRCKLSIEFPVNAPALVPAHCDITSHPRTQILNELLPHVPAERIDPSLIVWCITAQKDREYLQEELSFLKSLKESSYKYQKK